MPLQAGNKGTAVYITSRKWVVFLIFLVRRQLKLCVHESHQLVFVVVPTVGILVGVHAWEQVY
jgi:hypothetical protein